MWWNRNTKSGRLPIRVVDNNGDNLPIGSVFLFNEANGIYTSMLSAIRMNEVRSGKDSGAFKRFSRMFGRFLHGRPSITSAATKDDGSTRRLTLHEYARLQYLIPYFGHTYNKKTDGERSRQTILQRIAFIFKTRRQ